MFSLLSSALLMLSATPRLTMALPSYPDLRHTGLAPRAVNASVSYSRPFRLNTLAPLFLFSLYTTLLCAKEISGRVADRLP